MPLECVLRFLFVGYFTAFSVARVTSAPATTGRAQVVLPNSLVDDLPVVLEHVPLHQQHMWFITILNEGTTFRNKLWVFSLLFYFILHYMFRPISRPSSGAF
jgi:hypothetical protein